MTMRLTEDGTGGRAAGGRPRGLRIFHKLALIAGLSTLPVLALGYLYVTHMGQDIRLTELECRGVRVLDDLWPRFRAALFDDRSVAPGTQPDGLLGTPEQAEVFAGNLAAGGRTAALAWRDLIKRLADNSRLSVDPDLATLRAIDIVTDRLPDLTIAAYDINASLQGGRLGRSGNASLATFQQTLQVFQENLNAADALYFDAAIGERLTVAQARMNLAWAEFQARAIEFAASLEDVFEERRTPFQEYRELIVAISDFWEAATGSIEALLDHRAATQRADLMRTVALAGALMALVGLLVWQMSRSITRRIVALDGVMDRMRRGDLGLEVPHWRSGDEIGAMARSVRVFRAALVEKRRADGALVAQNDILSRKQAELQTQNVRFDAAINHMSQGLVMFDAEGNLIVCNDRFAEIYGLPSSLAAPGVRQDQIAEHVLNRRALPGADSAEVVKASLDARAGGKLPTRLLELRDGRAIFVQHRLMPGEGWVSTHEDVTERKRSETKIAYMAHHDALTGLPNRVRFRERLVDALAERRRDATVAVLYLDLDHFKGVNDTLGHPIGDALLRAVATRLKGALRESALVARLSGDEFAVVEADAASREEVAMLARRLVEFISEPYEIDGHQLVVGASVGIALAPADGEDGDQLLRNADMALYRAKADGRGTYRFFEPEMDVRIQARRQMELDLRGALTRGEFRLFYQPLVNAATREVSGFEALLRWIHPKRGLISPAEFIPLCEDIGLIVPLGEWVLRAACTEAAGWPEAIKVAVNLSPAQFRSRHLVDATIGALASAGLTPARLELEITESVLLQDNETTLSTLHQLRNLGVKISMDDFGTGYSSLSYLRSFPFDKLKIDQSFIRDLLRNRDSVAIIRAVTSLGRSLGMATSAEGVETEGQFETLRAEGCTEVQGFLFSEPRPASEIAAMMRRPPSGGVKAA